MSFLFTPFANSILGGDQASFLSVLCHCLFYFSLVVFTLIVAAGTGFILGSIKGYWSPAPAQPLAPVNCFDSRGYRVRMPQALAEVDHVFAQGQVCAASAVCLTLIGGCVVFLAAGVPSLAFLACFGLVAGVLRPVLAILPKLFGATVKGLYRVVCNLNSAIDAPPCAKRPAGKYPALKFAEHERDYGYRYRLNRF